MNSTLTFKFNAKPSVDEVISFGVVNALGGLSIAYIMTFKENRTTIAKAPISPSSGDSGIISTAHDYIKYLDLDYNNANVFEILPWALAVPTEITIRLNNPHKIFELYQNTADPDVEITIDNTDTELFSIDTVTGSEASSNPCDNIKLTVTTSEQADSIVTPIAQAVSSNPFIFDTVRGAGVKVLNMVKNGVSYLKSLRYPKLLSTYFDLDIVNTPTGATLNIVRLNEMAVIGSGQLMFSLEYSINDVDWQSSASFTNLAVDNYTLYIRDNIGCQIEIDFVVDEFTPNLIDFDPLFFVSNSNAIRMKEVVEFSNCGNRKLIGNTLSFEERDKLPFKRFFQIVQTCDINKTQFVSNYANQEAKLIDCDGNETDLPVVKKTQNMNRVDVRDATVVIETGTQVSLYFGTGYTYDPDTLLQSVPYNLGEALPSWLNVGDYVNLQGIGWVLVTEKLSPTDAIPYYRILLALTDTLLNTDDTIQVTSWYNSVNYERYEYVVDWSVIAEGHYKILLTGTDSNVDFPDKSYLSEWIDNRVKHDTPHYLIDYYHSKNNGEINYATGIRHRVRIPYVFNLKWKPNIEQDIFVTDTKTVSLKNRLREFYRFTAAKMPTAMSQKLTLILAHDRLFIDGQSYLLEGEPETSDPKATNMYAVSANLVRSDYTFDSASGLTLDEILLPEGEVLSIDQNAQGLLIIN